MIMKKGRDELTRYRNAYFLAISATTGYVCFGWETGLIGGVLALPSFQQYFGLDKESTAARAAFNGNITSVFLAGGIFGALVSTWLASRYGRKPPMLASAIVFLVGSVVQTIVGVGSTPMIGLKLFYLGRVLCGVGIGVTSALVPTYVSECAPRTIRGRCTGCAELATGLGLMLSFWVNYGASIQLPFGQMQWRLPIIIQIIPGALFFCLMLFQPESPRWLVEKERYEDAAKSLAYIARMDPCSPAVQFTLSEIRANFDSRPRYPSFLAQLRSMGENKTIALRCSIASLLAFLQQWSGSNGINYYAPQIFASLGFSSTTASLLATGILGVVKFFATCVGLPTLIDARSCGRKRTLFYGGLAQGLTLLWLAGYAALHPEHTVTPATYVSLVAVYLFGVCFSLGWGMTPPVLGAEIAPGHLRPAAMALASGVSWAMMYVIAQVTPWMLARLGWGTYAVFAGASVGMAVWAWAGVPETRGVALEDVQWLFCGSAGEVLVRCVEDAPGGKWVLRGRRAVSVDVLKARARADREGGCDVELEKRADADSSLII